MIRAADALGALRERLAPASTTAALDAEILVATVLGLDRARLAADPGRALAAEELFAGRGARQRSRKSRGRWRASHSRGAGQTGCHFGVSTARFTSRDASGLVDRLI
jgi:hypothetical protein